MQKLTYAPTVVCISVTIYSTYISRVSRGYIHLIYPGGVLRIPYLEKQFMNSVLFAKVEGSLRVQYCAVAHAD